MQPDGAERARVTDLGDATTLDRDTGAVRSVQKADLVIEEAVLREMWTPEYLERLARTYWRFLARVTLGLVHFRLSSVLARADPESRPPANPLFPPYAFGRRELGRTSLRAVRIVPRPARTPAFHLGAFD